MKRLKGKSLWFLILILLAGVTVILIVTGFYELGTLPETKEKAAEAEAVTEKESAGKDVEITISAAGDCTLGRNTGSAWAGSFDAVYDEKGADYFLENVKPVFDKDDMTIVNFEGTLTDSSAEQDKLFTFKGRDEYLDVLTESGVDFLSFANNHVHDFGEEGYQDSMDLFKEKGVPYASEDDVGTFKVKGITLGMISVHGDVEKEESDYIKSGIAKLKDMGVDLIIASIHTGIERDYYPSSKQINLAHTAVDEGADLVLEHHPHVIQGVEFYKGVYIDYSLGNFCFGGNKNPSDKDTVILQKTFRIKNGKLERDDQLKLIPCSISSTAAYNDYKPAILSGSDKKRVLDRLNRYSTAYRVSFDEDGNAEVADNQNSVGRTAAEAEQDSR